MAELLCDHIHVLHYEQSAEFSQVILDVKTMQAIHQVFVRISISTCHDANVA